ncbi:MAG: DNA repair protein RecN [Paludibacter sp.]|nr:DNA repair protein RecN [Paludibacter sp.]
MLKNLHINNYALISVLDINFETGFTVVTGETGAGKSIILGALSLILGNRADSKSIKSDADKCIIEARFDISAYKGINAFFDDNALDFDEKSCLIRREITNAGKSRAFINDTPVALNVLRDLSSRLIDIHSQHENLLLSNESFQLDIVDTIAKNTFVHDNYKTKFNHWNKLKTELKQLTLLAERQTAEQDYIQFQYQLLADAGLSIDEQTELESEYRMLNHAEEIKSALQKSVSLLDEDNKSLQLIKDIISSVSTVKKFIPQGESWYDRLQTTYIDLKDLSADISAYNEKTAFNPQRMEWINERLSEIYTLQKKFKTDSVDGLIELREQFGRKLLEIESYAEQIGMLEKNITESYRELKDEADKLTQSRLNACKPIELHLTEQMKMLGMPNVRFVVRVNQKDEFAENGQDEVQFFFSANKNREMQPVQQIASGGEISRMMLSIKSLVANKSNLPTIIFDEIDSGVSGEIAHRMGEIMQNMSCGMQVIAITHLPQIAAKGKQHFRVYKDESGIKAETFMKQLNTDERITELAQMLSGINVSDAAIKNARELLGV